MVTWTTMSMLEIDPYIACHKLVRTFNETNLAEEKVITLEWLGVIKEEVNKLLKAHFIQQVSPHYLPF